MAEDFLQEGFIKVFSRLHSFKFQGSFEGWVRRIMINTSLEMLRKHDVLRYSQGIDSSMPLQDDATDDNEAMEIDSETLFSVFQEMPPGFRTVFNLYAIEDYSHKEIGAMLKISEERLNLSMPGQDYGFRKD